MILLDNGHVVVKLVAKSTRRRGTKRKKCKRKRKNERDEKSLLLRSFRRRKSRGLLLRCPLRERLSVLTKLISKLSYISKLEDSFPLTLRERQKKKHRKKYLPDVSKNKLMLRRTITLAITPVCSMKKGKKKLHAESERPLISAPQSHRATILRARARRVLTSVRSSAEHYLADAR